jgi:cobalt-zinc-cadmium efflux system membrane fusion protein
MMDAGSRDDQPIGGFKISPTARLVLAVVVLISIAFVAYLLLGRSGLPEARQTDQPGEDEGEAWVVEIDDETAELVGVATAPVIEGHIEDTLLATGRVLAAPNNIAVVGAKVEGRVVRVLVEPGQPVRAGQPLAVLESPQVADLRGQLSEARARLTLAQQKRERAAKSENRAAVIQAKNRLNLAEKVLERKRRLAELGAAAAREVVEAENDYRNAKAEYEYQSSIQFTREQDEAASEVQQMQAVVSRLEQALEAIGAAGELGGTLTLKSPITGKVVDRRASIGQPVTAGSELLTVMDLTTVIIQAELPEWRASAVRAGQRVIARAAGLLFEGEVESVSSAVDTTKRTLAVRARVANKGGHLKHEMAVEVRVVTAERKQATLVPLSALVDDEGLKVVFIKEDHRFTRRVVTLGAVDGENAEVLSGLEPGRMVVTSGAYQVKNMRRGQGEEGGHHDEH